MNQQPYCPQCSQPLEDEQTFCPHCGPAVSLEEGPTLLGKQLLLQQRQDDVTCFPCSSCTSLVVGGSSYCNFCGEMLVRPPKKRENPIPIVLPPTSASIPRRASRLSRKPMPPLEISPTSPLALPMEDTFSSLLGHMLSMPNLSIWLPIGGAIFLELLVDINMHKWLPLQWFPEDARTMWPFPAQYLLILTQIISGFLIILGMFVACAWCINYDKKRGAHFLQFLFVVSIGVIPFLNLPFILNDISPSIGQIQDQVPGIVPLLINLFLAFLLGSVRVGLYRSRSRPF